MTAGCSLESLGRIAALSIASLLSFACGPFACFPPDSSFTSEETTVGDPRVQALLRAVDRPGRRAQGFSDLPVEGGATLWWPKPGHHELSAGRDRVSVSLGIGSRGGHKDWEFEKREGVDSLLWESERYFGVRAYRDRPEINSGRPFIESSRLMYGTSSATVDGLPRTVVLYDGRLGTREIPLALARRLWRAWGSYPIEKPERRSEKELTDAEQIAESRDLASRVFSGCQLFSWRGRDAWAFALVAAESAQGRSPRVLAGGATLEELIPILAELSPSTSVSWEVGGEEADGGDAEFQQPPREIVEMVASALSERNCTLTFSRRGRQASWTTEDRGTKYAVTRHLLRIGPQGSLVLTAVPRLSTAPPGRKGLDEEEISQPVR